MKRTFEAKIDNLDDVLNLVEEELTNHEASLKVIMPINVCVEEIFVNIASYAYEGSVGSCDIDIEFENDDVVITFTDTGMYFDPLAKQDPDINASAGERNIGGLGIYMVKKTMDKCEYQYLDNQNILTIRKKIKNV